MNTDTRFNSSSRLLLPLAHRGYIPKYPSRTLADDNLKSHSRSTLLKEELSDPQHIKLPVCFNTPRRFCPRKGRFTHDPDSQPEIDLESRTTMLKRLNDYKMLAFACKRAGKLQEEGRAYYSMGVIYDNLHQFKLAITSYGDFLRICEAVGDK